MALIKNVESDIIEGGLTMPCNEGVFLWCENHDSWPVGLIAHPVVNLQGIGRTEDVGDVTKAIDEVPANLRNKR